MCVAAIDLAKQVQAVQEDVKQKLHKANEKYKATVDKHRMLEIRVGLGVLVFE